MQPLAFTGRLSRPTVVGPAADGVRANPLSCGRGDGQPLEQAGRSPQATAFVAALACGSAVAARKRFTLRRRIAQQAQWSDDHGIGVEVMDGGSVVKRRNYTETPEGHCVAVSAEPMPAADRARGRTHYAEIKIENDCQMYGGGLEFGFTALTPAEVASFSPEDLRWSELEKTWVIREDGYLRFGGRPYPRDAMPGTGVVMEGFDTRRLEMGDVLGLRVEKQALVAFVNGEPKGRMELDEADIEAPVDGDLYFIADVVGKAAELELLDADVPE